MKLTIYGDPRTKKNSARILRTRSGTPFVAPSKAYVDYETDCLRQIKRPNSPISARVNVRCVYYMKTARRVDLANLIEATTDILVKARVLDYIGIGWEDVPEQAVQIKRIEDAVASMTTT